MYVHAKFQHYQEKQLKAVQKSQEKRAKAFVAPKEDAAPPKKKQKVSGIVNCFLLLPGTLFILIMDNDMTLNRIKVSSLPLTILSVPN